MSKSRPSPLFYPTEPEPGAQTHYFDYVYTSVVQKQAFLGDVRNDAMHQRDIGITPEDRLISLVTCSYEFYEARTMLIARRA